MDMIPTSGSNGGCSFKPRLQELSARTPSLGTD